jgi:hypothetical protein
LDSMTYDGRKWKLNFLTSQSDHISVICGHCYRLILFLSAKSLFASMLLTCQPFLLASDKLIYFCLRDRTWFDRFLYKKRSWTL